MIGSRLLLVLAAAGAGLWLASREAGDERADAIQDPTPAPTPTAAVDRLESLRRAVIAAEAAPTAGRALNGLTNAVEAIAGESAAGREEEYIALLSRAGAVFVGPGPYPKARADATLAVAVAAVRLAFLDLAARVLTDFEAVNPGERQGEFLRGEILAQIGIRRGEYRWARRQAERLLEIAKTKEDLAAQASLHGIIAETYVRTGVPDQAALHLDDEWKLAQRSGDASVLANATLRLAEFELGRGHARAVIYRVEEALQVVEWSPAHRAYLRMHLALARYLQAVQLADPTERVAAIAAAAAEFRQRLENSHLIPEIRIQGHLKLMKLALECGDLEESRRQSEEYRRALAAGQGAESPHWPALRSRLARLQGESDAELRDHRDRVAATLSEMLRSWAAQGERPGGLGFLRFDDRRYIVSERIELALALDADQGVERALQAVLEVQRCNSLALARGAPQCSVADVRRVLVRDGAGVLVFVPGPYGSYLFVLDEAGTECVRLPRGADVRSLAVKLDRRLARDPRVSADPVHENALVESARALSAEILPSSAGLAARVLSWSGATVVAGDLLGVPFSTLVVPAADGEGDALLGERLPIVEIGSLPLRLALEGSGELEPAYSAVVVACTDTHAEGAARAGLEPIPFPARLRARFSAAVGSEAQLLFDSEATAAALASLSGTSASVFHLVAHHVHDGRELGAALALADAVVDFETIAGMQVPGLCLLSSCKAGSGYRRPGDSPLATTLGGALFRAGAHTVVVSVAEVELGEEVEFAERVHRGLQQRLSPAEAVQRARRDLAGAGWTTRFVRAQTIVYGRGDRPLP